MEREALNKMLDAITILESISIFAGKVGLVFERNTMTGIIFSCERGYCSFGETDGKTLPVEVKGFLDLCRFMNILEAKKTVKGTFIEFRWMGRSCVLSWAGDEEINLPPWGSGNRLELGNDEIFNPGANLDRYYLMGQKFCFASAESFGVLNLQRNPGMQAELYSPFIKMFEIGWDVVEVVDKDVIFIQDDLKVLLRSGLEENEEDLEEKFERQVNLIKSKCSFCIEDPEAFKQLLDAMVEMRVIGAQMVGFQVKNNKLFLQAVASVGLRRVLMIPFTGTAAGSISGSVINLVRKRKNQLKRFYVNDKMALFEGEKVNVICILDDPVNIEA
jgi:hypothetical protein